MYDRDPRWRRSHKFRNTVLGLLALGVAGWYGVDNGYIDVHRNNDGTFAGHFIDLEFGDCNYDKQIPESGADKASVTAKLRNLATVCGGFCTKSVTLDDKSTGTPYNVCLDEKTMAITPLDNSPTRLLIDFNLSTRPTNSPPALLFMGMENVAAAGDDGCAKLKNDLKENFKPYLASIVGESSANQALVRIKVAAGGDHPCDDVSPYIPVFKP